MLPSYTNSLAARPGNLTIGVLNEGFKWPGASDREVDVLVMEAAEKFERLGAKVQQVSVPLHLEGLHIWTGIAVEGAWSMMVRGEGMGHNWQGYYDTNLLEFYGRARRQRGIEFSPTVKVVILLGQYLSSKFGGKFYSKAQNLRRTLRAAYDDALRQVDILLMPTTPKRPTKHNHDATLSEYLEIALNMMNNTATFDATGHPAMNVPCGKIGALPIGMMLVGRRYDEVTLLRAGHLFEQAAFSDT